MMKKLTLFALLAASPAMAHPGHGGDAMHWFGDITHLGILILLGLAISPLISLHLRPERRESEDDHEG